MATKGPRVTADDVDWRAISPSIVLLALGAALVIGSFFPFGRLATKRLWTRDDAIAYDRISLEYHRSALEPSSRNGRTAEETAEHLANLKRQFTAMHERLERAHQQPHLWSRYLLWTGALLAAAGGACHVRGR